MPAFSCRQSVCVFWIRISQRQCDLLSGSYQWYPTSLCLVMNNNFDHWLKVESFRLSHIKSPFFPSGQICWWVPFTTMWMPGFLLKCCSIESDSPRRFWQAVITVNGSILTGSFRSLYSCAQGPWNSSVWLSLESRHLPCRVLTDLTL